MNTIEKVKEIANHGEHFKNISEVDFKSFEMLRDLTDNFKDIDESLFDDDFKKEIDILHSKIVKEDKQDSAKDKPKADKKVKSEAEPKSETETGTKPQSEKKEGNKKAEKEAKVVEEYKGKYVTKESVEHVIVRRFLALRAKGSQPHLCKNAYVNLQKMIEGREVRKTSEYADLIMAIQNSYYKLVKGATKELELVDAQLVTAMSVFENEKRYGSVELMSTYAGWSGLTKTEKQIANYLVRAENVLKASKHSDPYYDELVSVVKALKEAKAGDIIVPESVGLSGLGSEYGIKVFDEKMEQKKASIENYEGKIVRLKEQLEEYGKSDSEKAKIIERIERNREDLAKEIFDSIGIYFVDSQ